MASRGYPGPEGLAASNDLVSQRHQMFSGNIPAPTPPPAVMLSHIGVERLRAGAEADGGRGGLPRVDDIDQRCEAYRLLYLQERKANLRNIEKVECLREALRSVAAAQRGKQQYVGPGTGERLDAVEVLVDRLEDLKRGAASLADSMAGICSSIGVAASLPSLSDSGAERSPLSAIRGERVVETDGRLLALSERALRFLSAVRDLDPVLEDAYHRLLKVVTMPGGMFIDEDIAAAASRGDAGGAAGSFQVGALAGFPSDQLLLAKTFMGAGAAHGERGAGVDLSSAAREAMGTRGGGQQTSAGTLQAHASLSSPGPPAPLSVFVPTADGAQFGTYDYATNPYRFPKLPFSGTASSFPVDKSPPGHPLSASASARQSPLQQKGFLGPIEVVSPSPINPQQSVPFPSQSPKKPFADTRAASTTSPFEPPVLAKARLSKDQPRESRDWEEADDSVEEYFKSPKQRSKDEERGDLGGERKGERNEEKDKETNNEQESTNEEGTATNHVSSEPPTNEAGTVLQTQKASPLVASETAEKGPREKEAAIDKASVEDEKKKDDVVPTRHHEATTAKPPSPEGAHAESDNDVSIVLPSQWAARQAAAKRAEEAEKEKEREKNRLVASAGIKTPALSLVPPSKPETERDSSVPDSNQSPSPLASSFQTQAAQRVTEGKKETAPTLLAEKDNEKGDKQSSPVESAVLEEQSAAATPREPVGGCADLQAVSTSSPLPKPKPKGPPPKQAPSIRIEEGTRGPASASGNPNNSGPLSPSGNLNTSQAAQAKKKPPPPKGPPPGAVALLSAAGSPVGKSLQASGGSSPSAKSPGGSLLKSAPPSRASLTLAGASADAAKSLPQSPSAKSPKPSEPPPKTSFPSPTPSASVSFVNDQGAKAPLAASQESVSSPPSRTPSMGGKSGAFFKAPPPPPKVTSKPPPPPLKVVSPSASRTPVDLEVKDETGLSLTVGRDGESPRVEVAPSPTSSRGPPPKILSASSGSAPSPPKTKPSPPSLPPSASGGLSPAASSVALPPSSPSNGQAKGPNPPPPKIMKSTPNGTAATLAVSGTSTASPTAMHSKPAPPPFPGGSPPKGILSKSEAPSSKPKPPPPSVPGGLSPSKSAAPGSPAGALSTSQLSQPDSVNSVGAASAASYTGGVAAPPPKKVPPPKGPPPKKPKGPPPPPPKASAASP
uniref:Uncharacterized protein n=1 Tax=Chromera velia CCMP2878 TaxID=1169474 RepID=A0A0G4F3E0_9ALVE|eukprot:Cvel_2700.t1-p1 / transcript=Cvel_2700.t1 / gene=Cvel_2700 / organism=Chromera_velia_CCMP2878 / gene_product=hypothetical protein / transcript_product=hypothetical protein / location=Cvel_scaffold108:36314-45358(+) / protein_length=1178 / sequence_SO=supercontig / SO=protein_coding / is_pseudo=false